MADTQQAVLTHGLLAPQSLYTYSISKSALTFLTAFLNEQEGHGLML
jgi:hypothetical protein